jgi:hypothetical protein
LNLLAAARDEGWHIESPQGATIMMEFADIFAETSTTAVFVWCSVVALGAYAAVALWLTRSREMQPRLTVRPA